MTKKDKFNNINIKTGLTKEEVESRYKKGLINYDVSTNTKSVKEIVKENSITLFNILNLILAIAVISVGSFKNATFIGIIIINTSISIFQQLRSKTILDKLKIVASKKVQVKRDSELLNIDIEQIVIDDIIIYKTGSQIVVDSIVKDGTVEVDESFITGESDTIIKEKGDKLLSGSYIVSGKVTAQVEHIGLDNYTAKLANNTKYIKTVSSEIMTSLNKIVKYISVLIIPIAILLFYRQLYLDGNNITNAIVNTTAALIGMIPEGLILLTSTTLAVGVYNLSKKRVLVQDLYCIETLARVDTLCLDKTGTLTLGEMEVVKDEKITDLDIEIGKIACLICEETNDDNQTSRAIKQKYKEKLDCKVKDVITFSSKRKLSGVILEDDTKYILGAPEFVLKDKKNYQELIDEYSEKYRVLAVAKETDELELLGFILIQDQIRKNTKETLDYFKKEDVCLKIISGDNPLTVASIAKRAGMTDLNVIDATKLKTDDDIIEAVEKYNVFGRVTPEQKRDFIIALQNNNHTVAMTGDGVNDVLALKEADCSVAMSNGSDATKNVSQLVLLDSDFSAMPYVVREGRRSINNIQRSASLFLNKTIYSFILSILFIFIKKAYPFVPIQLTIVSFCTVGTPAFLLSFEPNNEKIKGSFLINVLKNSIPSAIIVVINIILITMISNILKISYQESSTVSVFMIGFITFMLLLKISKPLNKFRTVLIIAMFILFIFGFLNMQNLFSFANFNVKMISLSSFCIIISIYLYKLFNERVYYLLEKLKKMREI